MLDPETRPSLIVRLRDPNDQSAWWAFAQDYESFLKHLAIRLGVPTHHVADVTQQILLAIATSVDQWSADGREASFRRWVHTIARHTVIKFMAGVRRHPAPLGGSDAIRMLDAQVHPNDPSIERQYDHELIVWAAGKVRHEFAATSWQAFIRTMIDGEPVTDVAASLGVSTGSIYMSRSRIIARIRILIDEVMQ